MTNPAMMYAGGPGGFLTGLNPRLTGVPQPSAQPPAALQPFPPGYWSQLAYQMAGNPNQGPYGAVAVPPAPPGSSGVGGGGGAGSAALGILGALGKNGNTASSVISKLFGGGNIASQGAANNAAYTSGLLSDAGAQAGAAGIAPVGTGAIDSAADAAAGADYGLGAGTTAGAGAAADAGATAAGADAGAAGLGGAGSAASAADIGAGSAASGTGAASGALGAGAGAAAALAPLGITAYLAMTQPAVALGGKWYSNYQNALNQNKANGTLYNSGVGLQGANSSDPRQLQMLLNAGFSPADIAAMQYQNPNLIASPTGSRNVGHK